jgi:excisionase family DNA binding protein
MVERLLTIHEAAEMTAMSVDWFRKRIWRGQLPVVRLGRAVRLRQSVLADLLNGKVNAPMRRRATVSPTR